MSRTRLLHVASADISLVFLLGPQLRAFSDAGYEVLAASAPGPYADRLAADGITHIPLRHVTRGWSLRRDGRAVTELHSLFRTLRPAIVHTHNPKPGVYGRIAARAARVPAIVNTQHGLYATRDDPFPRRAGVYGLERLAAGCSDAELVQNAEDLETLAHLRVPRDRLTLLGNGIDLQRFDPERVAPDASAALRRDLDPGGSAVLVGAIGRLVREKGYLELFSAMEEVRATHPHAVLVVAGPTDEDKADGLTAAELEAARRAGVRFLGMVEEVETLYAALDLYVLASHREGFPRSAMEAAAMSLPVIATDIRGCRQVVADGTTGRLVERGSAESLGAAIKELVASADLRQAWGRAGRVKAKAEFDQQRVIEITLEAYARLHPVPAH